LPAAAIAFEAATLFEVRSFKNAGKDNFSEEDGGIA
jgi:hypothetical protein